MAARAIDGNKDPEFGKNGQTHTNNSGEKNPWWELDLKEPRTIEKIQIWNRRAFESRMDGVTVKLLDAGSGVSGPPLITPAVIAARK